MKSTVLSALLIAPLSASAAPWQVPEHRGGPHGYPGQYGGQAAKVAYLLDNNPAGSSLVSLEIGSDGMLSNPMRTSTGGYGAIGTSTMGVPNTADSLYSQGAVAVGEDMVITVNAGSNTLALFRIDPRDPMHLALVGQPADTMGEFPMSVAYSEKLQMACTLNGGAKPGVACFHVNPYHGLYAAGGLRTTANASHESTPPTGPPLSSSQILFNPDSTAVFAIIKGDAAVSQAGYILAYPVDSHGMVADQPVVNQIQDVQMDFGSVFITPRQLFMVDPSYGVSVLEVAADFTITEKVHTVVPSQKAICWAAYDADLDTAYGIDAAQPSVFTFNPDTGADTGVFMADNSSAKGLLDSAIGNGKMYSLTADGGVVVFDLEAEKQVQFLNLTSFGDTQGYQGMALWPSM